jgi:hypothetical protein
MITNAGYQMNRAAILFRWFRHCACLDYCL